MRLHLRGRRFLNRRLDLAVQGRSPSTRPRTLQDQKLSLQVGCLIAAGILVAGALMALIKPAAGPGGADLVMSRQSGALFVRVGTALHPVADLSSAQLILGSPVTPRLVDDDHLGAVEPGPMLGIPGAPQRIGTQLSPADVRWTVCDNSDGSTTVGAGRSAGTEDLASRGRPRVALVRAVHGDGTIYLLYDGKRAAIDPGNPVIERTFQLGGVAARPVSSTLLNLIPEVSSIVVPQISNAGQPSMAHGIPIGAVVQVERSGLNKKSADHYVVLNHGLQRIGRAAADLLRFAYSGASAEIVTVAADVVAAEPLVDELPLGTYPEEVPTGLGRDSQTKADSVCAMWSGGGTVITSSAPVASPIPVRLVQADGPGPAVDFVAIPRGYSVLTVAITGSDETGPGHRYLITDAGVRFAVDDSESAKALGLTGQPAIAPWSLIATLPAGPELNRTVASAARDVLDVRSPAPH